MSDALPPAMLQEHSPHVRKPFGERPIWHKAADGRVTWLTPRQMGLDEDAIAAVEALEAAGDAAPRPEPVAPPPPEPIPFQPARVVFGRMSQRAGRKLARQAEAAQAAQQEALL